MSVAFTKEEDTEAAAAYLPERPISKHPNFVTQTGLAKLDAAVVAAKAAVALAQASDDLKTNRSAMTQAMRDLRYFTARRASAQLVETSRDNGIVAFGGLVSFRREDGRVQSFRIVGEDEADVSQGTISYVSPIARTLTGKRVGDVATLGNSSLEVVSIE